MRCKTSVRMCFSVWIISLILGCTSNSEPTRTQNVQPSETNPATIVTETGSSGTNAISNNLKSNKIETAPGDINDLKNNLSHIPALAAPFLKKASQLKYVPAQKGQPLTDSECEQIEKNISSNYSISPFTVTYNQGSAHFGVCTDSFGQPLSKSGIKILFLNNVSIKSQFGFNGVMLLQNISQNIVRSEEVLTSLLLDQDYRILEVSSLYTTLPTNDPFLYSVRTLDTNGDYYYNEYWDSNSNAPHAFTTHQLYISADGKYRFQQDLKPRRAEKGSERVLSTTFKIADDLDWDTHTLILTHAWFSGFYDYQGVLKRNPEAYSFLSINSVNGKEVCADGSTTDQTTWTRYPSPTADQGYCSNDW